MCVVCEVMTECAMVVIDGRVCDDGDGRVCDGGDGRVCDDGDG